MEDCLSGRKERFAKSSILNGVHWFESNIFHQTCDGVATLSQSAEERETRNLPRVHSIRSRTFRRVAWCTHIMEE